MPAPLIPEAPENMPSFGNVLTRAIGRGILRLCGWRVTGSLPNEKKVLIAAAPHTSNWDFVVVVGGLMALGMKVSAMMKKEAFFWPCKGLFLKLGFLPTDRNAAEGIVGQIHRMFDEHDKLWIGITPEGTRSKVDRWKTGFLRIAQDSNVPILLLAFDGPGKRIVLDKVVMATENFDEQAEELRQYVHENFEGINAHKQ